MIAVVLWGYVVIYVNPTKEETISAVPVELINIDNLEARGLAIAGEEEYTVDVVVKGKRGDLARIKPEDLLANADLFGFTIGKNYIPVKVTVPDSLSIVEIKSAQIVVNIEALVAESKAVKIEFSGDFKDGTEPGQISTQPEAIEVSGAKSIINQVAYIKAQIPADQVTREGGEIQATAVPINSNGETVKNVKLSSTDISVYAKLLDVKEVKLETIITGEPGKQYEVTALNVPEKVKIRGEKAYLKNIESVTATAIDISGVTKDAIIPIRILLPEGVELAEDSKNPEVSIKLKGITTKTFEYGAFEFIVEGLPENLSLSIDTTVIQVIVSGKENVMATLAKSDFIPHINLKDATVETLKAKVAIVHDKQVSAVEILPIEVDITLSEVVE